jgi:uncharacterized membrane protein YhaH (DUF805 family)
VANPIIRGFSKLTQFSGRDTRGEFWPYAGVVMALTMVSSAMAAGVVMSRVMASYSSPQLVIAPVAPSDPVLLEVVEAPPPEMPPMPDLQPIFWIQGATLILLIGLLAAAVVRRLHDRNTPGWVGLAPVPFLLFGIIGFAIVFRQFGEEGPNFGLFGLLFLNNILYMIALVTLIVLLSLRGAPGPNRYGPATVAPATNPRDDWSTPS